MTDVIRFAVPLPPPGLRRNRETMNHGARAKLKDEYSERVWCAGRDASTPEDGRRDGWCWYRAHLRLTWKHAGVAPDHDNALASLKVLIDCLHTKGRRPLGIVIDDSPDHLTVELKTRKVAHRPDEGVDV